MSNHEHGNSLRSAGIAASAIILLTACSGAESTTVKLPGEDFMVVYEGTDVFDGKATDTSNTDSNNQLGELRSAVLFREYKFVDRGSGVDDLVCLDKDTVGRDNLTTTQSGWTWKFMGDICVRANRVKQPSGELVYPNS